MRTICQLKRDSDLSMRKLFPVEMKGNIKSSETSRHYGLINWDHTTIVDY
jgi:hypothetical protein